MFPLFLPHNIIMIIITMIHSWPIVLLILLSIWPHSSYAATGVDDDDDDDNKGNLGAAEYIIQSVCFGYFISSGESVVHQTPQKSIKRPPSTWNSYYYECCINNNFFCLFNC